MTQSNTTEDDITRARMSNVVVIKRPGSTNAFQVVPGTLMVPPEGKTIWIRNATAFPVRVTFPPPIGNTPVPIDPKRPAQVVLNAADVDVYEYTVEVDVNGTMIGAEGNSNPRIVYG